MDLKPNDTPVEKWDNIIGEAAGPFSFNIREIWRYRDLMGMFVKKDIITYYKQTILGPIWFVLQPILTTLMFVLVFGNIAKIPTNGIPPILFYLSSLTLWNYFADTFNLTSKTFIDNAPIFGKVYFPRMVLPISKLISGLVKFLVQFALFIVVWVYYIVTNHSIHPNIYILYFPLILILVGAISLGMGIIVTSLTTKYRDLTFLVAFGVQLLMYATPVIYPISIASPRKQFWLWLNPLTSLFELFKYGFLGNGVVNYSWLLYTVVFSFFLLLFGFMIFSKVEKRFIDTV